MNNRNIANRTLVDIVLLVIALTVMVGGVFGKEITKSFKKHGAVQTSNFQPGDCILYVYDTPEWEPNRFTIQKVIKVSADHYLLEYLRTGPNKILVGDRTTSHRILVDDLSQKIDCDEVDEIADRLLKPKKEK